MTQVSQPLDRVEDILDDDNLAANAGLILPATLAGQLELEPFDQRHHEAHGSGGWRQAGAQGIDAGACDPCGHLTHIDHADVLRAPGSVLSHRVMAPSTLGSPNRDRSSLAWVRAPRR